MDLGYDIPVPAEDGSFVSEKHARIAEIINEYDPNLSLVWIPPAKRVPGDPPFAVLAHQNGNRPDYIVCYAEDCDERLLARVFEMDAAKGNGLQRVDKMNEAVRALQLKKQMEDIEEANELAASILRSPKSTYKHAGIKYT